MGGQQADESEAGRVPGGGWPVGLRRLVSAILIFHISAILVGALSSPPSSLLERSLADTFAPYFQVIDQGYAYRYYAPEPPPTPVVTATIHFADGRPGRDGPASPQGRRCPGSCGSGNWRWPITSTPTPRPPARGRRRRARAAGRRSYARHLAQTHPGCSSIVLTVAAAPDPRRRAGSRAARKAGLEAGGPRRRGVLHHARADRRVPVRRLLNDLGGYLARLGRTDRPGLERLLLHPGRPDRRWA